MEHFKIIVESKIIICVSVYVDTNCLICWSLKIIKLYLLLGIYFKESTFQKFLIVNKKL